MKSRIFFGQLLNSMCPNVGGEKLAKLKNQVKISQIQPHVIPDYIRREMEIVRNIFMKYFSQYDIQDRFEANSDYPWIIALKIRKFCRLNERDKIDLHNYATSYHITEKTSFSQLRDDLRVFIRVMPHKEATNVTKNLQ